MDKTFLFLMPLIALALIIIPLVITLKRKKSGQVGEYKKIGADKRLLLYRLYGTYDLYYACFCKCGGCRGCG